MKRLILTFAVTTALFSACGGDTDTVDPSETSGLVESTTTTTIDPIFAAGEYYREKATAVGCARELNELAISTFDASQQERWEGEWNYSEVLIWEAFQKEVLSLREGLANSYILFVGELGAYEWPDGLQTSIDALISQTLEIASENLRISEVKMMKEYQNFSFNVVDETNHAGIIRAKLGLPSNVNNDENFCANIFG